ncbi:MAG: protease inhibitor I42 family protein [Planctomycetes bacterium]|nr:protease inhibitor I42 family protein [Planctomycetota bacterium]
MRSITKTRKRNSKRTNHRLHGQFEHLERRDLFAGLPGFISMGAMHDFHVDGGKLVATGSPREEIVEVRYDAPSALGVADTWSQHLPAASGTTDARNGEGDVDLAVGALEENGTVDANLRDAGMVGVPGECMFEFKAVNPGAATLILVYARPWDNAGAAAKQFVASIQVSPEFPVPLPWVPVDRLPVAIPEKPDQVTGHKPWFGARPDPAIDRVLSEVQPWWNALDSAVETLTPSVEASGEAELDVLGCSAEATLDLDWTDGNVGCGVAASVYLLAAAAEGRFETDSVNVGGVEIVGYGEGSTCIIVGTHASADVTLGVQGLELRSRIVVGAELTAAGKATADIGGLEATVGGEAVVYVVAGLDASLGVTAEGLQLEATAFAGARFQVTGEAELGGVGIEATAEAWAGIGCTAEADLSVKNGKLNVELALGIGLGVGGKLGLGFSIDVCEVRDNVMNAGERAGAFVIDAKQQVDDAAKSVGAFVTDTAEHAGKFVHSAGNDVKEAVNHVANKVERTVNKVGNFFRRLF